MTADLPDYYFRVRENGAVVFRLGTENRQRRIEMDEIATVNVKNGNIKPPGEVELTEAYHQRPSMMFHDKNGDGSYQDQFVWGEEDEAWQRDIPALAFNKGASFAPASPTLPASLQPQPDGLALDPIPWTWTDALGEAAIPIDYNGDGRMDIMMPMFGHCGDDNIDRACWVAMIAPTTGADYFRIVETAIEFDPNYRDFGWWRAKVTDVDGDGRHDILVPVQHDPGKFEIYKNDGPQDLLTGVSDGTNPLDPGDPGFVPNVTIKYGSLIDYTITQGIDRDNVHYDAHTYVSRSHDRAHCNYPISCVVGPARVVRGYSLNNGQNGERSFALKYRDGRYHRLGRGFLGFGARMTWDLDTAGGSAEFYDWMTVDPSGAALTFPFAGHPTRTWTWSAQSPDRYDPGQVEMSFTDRGYDMRLSAGGSTYFTIPTITGVERQESVMTPGPDQTIFRHVKAAESTHTSVLGRTFSHVLGYDDYGNVLNETSTAEGVDLETSVARVFDNNPTNWLIGMLESESTCSTAMNSTQCRAVSLSRNQYGEVLTRQVGDPVDPATQVSQSFSYDQYGHVIHSSASDTFGNVRSACVSYDEEGVFPYAHANGLSHVGYTKFDRRFGSILASVDPNGQVTQWQYDSFGRQNIERSEYNLKTTRFEREKNHGPSKSWWGTTVTTDETGGDLTWTTLDGLGRVTSTRTRGPKVETCGASWCTWSADIESSVEYNSLGQVAHVSLPWMVGDSLHGMLRHDYSYDASGRLVLHIDPWQRQTVFGYGNNVRTSLDWIGTTSVEVDALGRVVRSIDKQGYTTEPTYGPFSAVRRVTRNGSEVTEFDHDAFGRVTYENDLDRGETHVAHNGFGDVRSMMDANGRSYKFQHDGLGRLRLREDADGITEWAYDTKPYGIGMAASVTSPAGHVKEYGYDKHSRLESTLLRFGDTGAEFEARYEYDGLDRISAVTYPALPGQQPLIVVRDYDDRGNLVNVRNWDTGESYWELAGADGAGRATIETLGHPEFQTRRRYSPATGLLTGIQTDRLTQRLQDLEYSYDDGLRMRRRTTRVGQANAGGIRSEHFVHDKLDRLTCAYWSDSESDAPPPIDDKCDLLVRYAANGNIEHKSDVGDYIYGTANQPHVVRAAGSADFAYDNVGNQITRPGVESIAYTAFDLPALIDRFAGGSIRLDYDGDQHRIRKTTEEQQTTYFEGLYELVEDLTTHKLKERHYISAGSSTAVLTRDDAGQKLAYVLSEALGSTDVIVDGDGIERRSFDAFGARRNPQWGEPASGSLNKSPVTPMGYTGHESDDELGLVNMKGRIYDPKVGRFLQTDPIVGDPHFGQAWNPYSYVLNSPLMFVDPTGFQVADRTPDMPRGCDATCYFSGPDGRWYKPVSDDNTGRSRTTFSMEPRDSGRDDAHTQSPGMEKADQVQGWRQLPAASRVPFVLEDAGADKWNPHSAAGRLFESVFGAPRPLPQWEPPAALVQAGVGLAPGGGTLQAFLDPNATGWSIAGAVALDALSLVGVGMAVKFGKAIKGGPRVFQAARAVAGVTDDAARNAFRGPKVTHELAEALGMERRELGKSLEAIKKATGLGGRDNVVINRATGDVFDARTAEHIGNLFDEAVK